MLSALLQTIANLGLDGGAINSAFSAVFDAVKAGDLSAVEGVGGLVSGLFSLFTGVSAGEAGSVAGAILMGVVDMLRSVSASSIFSAITGG